MLAIRDVMTLIPNDVATVAMGIAASAGQFLLSAGTKGKRYALPHARVLLHQGSAGIGGTAMDIAIQADDLRHTRDTVLAADRRGHRAGRRDRRARLAARPVVQRRRGARLRVRRPHRRARSTTSDARRTAPLGLGRRCAR